MKKLLLLLFLPALVFAQSKKEQRLLKKADKIHARGPVGLEGLTSQKWVVFGDGQIRQ